MEILSLIAFVLFLVAIMAVVVWEAKNLKPIPTPELPSHSHNGLVRSQHEVGGKQMLVYECKDCGLHFTAEALPKDAPSLAATREALGNFEASHRKERQLDVNGNAVTETILCDCPQCVAARAVLGS